ncbi:MAG: zinc ABC transporter substrate-binding protein [Candidatus Nucleicultricaceae bacterium]
MKKVFFALRHKLSVVGFLFLFQCVWSSTLCAEGPRVLVSIPPLYGLVAKVMRGVAEPEVLLDAYVSPHVFHPTPHEMEKVVEADLLIWVGPGLEVGLSQLLGARKKSSFAVIEASGLRLLPLRADADFEAHDHAHDHEGPTHHHTHHQHEHDHDDGHVVGRTSIDPHIWLDPDNALAILMYVKNILQDKDPGHLEQYEQNYLEAVKQIQQLKQELAASIESFQGVPYIVFHDGYQYFEKAYGLKGLGSFVMEIDAPPSLKRIKMLEDKIHDKGAVCLFAEPQFNQDLLHRVSDQYTISIGILDYMGIGIPLGPDTYDLMMKNLVASYKGCLHDRTRTKTP